MRFPPSEEDLLAPTRMLISDVGGLREESDEELRARLLGRATRRFDDLELRTVVHCEADKIDAPRTLRIEKRGAGCYDVYVRGVLPSWRSELSARIAESVPAWVNVSVLEDD